MSDDVNEYGLGAPNTQTDEAGDHVHEADQGSGLGHGLGPSEGPFLGEAAAEEEGVRFGLGSDNTQDGDVVHDPAADSDIQYQPGAQPVRPDPLEHGLESEDVP
jgi:hypothetical protein